MQTKDSILIIEDDELFLKSLVNLLNQEGYDVDSAKNGQEAIELAKNKCFDLIIADIRLPGGMDGIDTVKAIKELRPETKTMVILITGYTEPEAPIRAIKAGVDDYIYKPFELDYFLRSIRRNLNILKLEKQKKEYIEELEALENELEEYNKELENEIKKKTKELTLLFEIGKEFTSSLRLDEVLTTVVKRVCDALGVEICSIILADENKDELFIAAAKGLTQDIIAETRIKKGEKISGWVFANKSAILVKDIEKDPRFAKENEAKYYTGSFISVPLVFKGRAIGVINVNNKSSREIFKEDDLRLIEGIADEASIAIENAKLYTNLEKVYLQIIATLTSIIQLKDHYTKGHSERVTHYAVAIAEAMQLPRSDIEIIRLSCQLHDLGKIGIQENILNKPDKLTEDEWKEIKLHPLKSVEILSPLLFLKEEVKLIEQHHERYDGKGYPYGLKGEDIDLKARIMAVADSFDAMITERPYRKALSKEEAINELKKCSGSQFDPKIVEVFLKVLEQKPELVPLQSERNSTS